MGSPFERKPSWKLRPLFNLSLNRKWLYVQRSKAYILRVSVKSSISILFLSLSTNRLIYVTSALQKMEPHFLLVDRL